jgi:hypothetical protein|tara:strand:- start:1077 stop:1289 length:213 start_codon:yes stop_codon:yes gene_type:complete
MATRRQRRLRRSNIKNQVTGEVTKVQNTRLEAFKKKHGRGPATDSEIDQVYGRGAADKAYGDAMKKRKKR